MPLKAVNHSRSVHSFKEMPDGRPGTSQIFDPLLFNMNGLFREGSQRPLEMDALGEIAEDSSTSVVHKQFQLAWEKELELPAEKRSFWRALRRSVGWQRPTIAIFLAILSANSVFAVPLLQVSVSIIIDIN